MIIAPILLGGTILALLVGLHSGIEALRNREKQRGLAITGVILNAALLAALLIALIVVSNSGPILT